MKFGFLDELICTPHLNAVIEGKDYREINASNQDIRKSSKPSARFVLTDKARNVPLVI